MSKPHPKPKPRLASRNVGWALVGEFRDSIPTRVSPSRFTSLDHDGRLEGWCESRAGSAGDPPLDEEGASRHPLDLTLELRIRGLGR